MFPVYVLDPSRQKQRRCGRPCFGEDQPHFWRLGNSCGRPHFGGGEFGQGSEMYIPFENFMKKFAAKQEKSEKRDFGKEEQTKTNMEEPKPGEKDKTRETNKDSGATSFHSLVNDVVRNAMQSYHAATQPTKWRQEVDCRGFKSKDIKVKIEARLLLIKANKREESDIGVSTSSMRKNVPLPENIDHKKITCKLSPQGILVVEAPFLDKTKDPESKHDFLCDLMSTILPGVESVLASHYVQRAADERENENGEENPKTDNNETGQGTTEGADKSHVTTDDKSQGTTDDKSHMTTDDKSQGTTDDKSHVTTDDKSQGTTDDKSHMTTDDKSQGTTDDKSREITDDKSRVTTDDMPGEEAFPEAEAQPVASEETSKMTVVGSGDSTENPPNVKDNDHKDETAASFGDDPESSESRQADNASTSSEDSFVLLTELEKEEKAASLKQDGDEEIEDGAVSFTVYEEEEDKLEEDVEEKEVEEKEESKDLPVHRNEEAFVYRVEMPSYTPESIQVNFDESQRVLVISATKERQPGTPGDSITKRVPVGEHVDVDNLHCFYRDGSLTVSAPVRPPVRRIPVRV